MRISCRNKTIFSIMNDRNDIKSLIAAIVISSQIVKIFTIVNPIVDVFFQVILFILCLPKLKSLRKVNRKNIVFALTFIYIISVTYISSLYSVSYELPLVLLKSAFVICTCLSAMTFSKYEISKTLGYFVLINAIYSILILVGKVPYTSSFNYLNYTLPLGCACTILLNRIIYQKITVFNILLTCLCIFALTRFSARGPFIFLLLQIIITCIFNRHKVKGLAILTMAGLAVFCFLFIVPHDQSFSLASRLLNMLGNNSLEIGTRDQILSTYWNKLTDSWFFGYGIGSSRTFLAGSYPHNYLLQIWGELGIVSFIVIILCNIVLYYRFFINAVRKNISFLQIEIFFALSYYEFQFFKSFDLLSSYPLWIFFIFLLKSLDRATISSINYDRLKLLNAKR